MDIWIYLFVNNEVVTSHILLKNSYIHEAQNLGVQLYILSPAYEYYWPVIDLPLCIYEYINDQKQGIYIFIIAQL